jgi:hypothetical protein
LFGLAYVCLALLPSLTSAAPIVSADGRDCASSRCTLDISLFYENSQENRDLPSSLLEFLSSATGLSDLDLKRSGKFRGFRDVRFSHPRHATNDHSDAVAAPEGMSAPENDRHAEDNGTPSFSAFFKLTAPSVSCADLAAKFPRPSSAALASALRVTSVLNFFGVPAKGQRCSDNDEESDDVPSAASVVQGSIELVISDFEDGSSDRFGEITTADGAIVAVGGPDSNDAADQSAWSSIRSGDRVKWRLTPMRSAPTEWTK